MTKKSFVRRRTLLLSAMTLASIVGLREPAMATVAPRAVTPGSTHNAAAPYGMPQGDLPGWKLAFADDFGGSTLGAKWFAYAGQPGGDPGGYWARSHVAVANGQLVLRGFRDPQYGDRFVTGGVSSAHGFVQTYGKYYVRFRMSEGKGVAHAIMLWPADNVWPPEIDFSEDNGLAPRSTLTTTVHYSTPDRLDSMIHRSRPANFTQWHTVGVEWKPGSVVYTYDGKPWSSVVGPVSPSAPMALAIQTQAWSCGTNAWEECLDPSSRPTVNLYVDWVVAYSPA